MRKIDLSYLNDYAGQGVNVMELLDPRYYDGQESQVYTGTLNSAYNRFMVEINKGKFEEDMFSGEILVSTPYLGKTESVWDITLIKDGSKLLTHKLWNKELGRYIVLGPDDAEIGFLDCVKMPYGPPYGDLLQLEKRLREDLKIIVWLRKPDKYEELKKILESLEKEADELYQIWRLQNTDSVRRFNTQTRMFE